MPTLHPAGRRVGALSALALVATLALAGCGDSSETASDTSSDESSSAASGAPQGGGPGGMFDDETREQINACLTAAGLDELPEMEGPGGGTPPSDMPSGAPSGAPSDMPSDMPSDFPSDMPSDMPSDLPSDMPEGGPGGGRGGFLSDEQQAALTACGIELPTPSGFPQGGEGAPSDSATASS